MACHGVVAAGHELTARAAETILREGGNAFDAILAGHFAACVAEPVLASLGGGGFLIARPQGAPPVVYDFFVQTPRQKRPVDQLDFRPIVADFGTTQQEFHIGQGTIATPGSVKGIFRIHRELGSMPLAQIAAPAIQFAREGVTLTAIQAYVLRIVQPIYVATPEARDIFCSNPAQSRILVEGETLRQTELADTIERLVKEGDGLFYQGEIGREIVQQCREAGGQLTAEDLRMYDVIRRQPLTANFGRAVVLTNPPPSSGGTLIAFSLELIKAAELRRETFGSYAHLRLLAEVMALANKARVDALASRSIKDDHSLDLLAPATLERYRATVLGRSQAIRGTTQLSVIDSRGNVASMTLSNGEGCGGIVAHTGIMLNNMLGEADLNVGGFHVWNSDQRMTSMMAPTLIQAPQHTWIATGSGGSNRIRTALLQVILNLVHFQMDVATAVVSPRIHVEGNKLSVEGGFSDESIDRLLVHFPEHQVWAEKNLFFGGAHTVIDRNGQLNGAGDPRRGGVCRLVE